MVFFQTARWFHTANDFEPTKMAGLYFRHCQPYIGLWIAAAKGDREDD
jgi:hypothetical protein